MNPNLRNVLAVIVGFLAGSAVNLALVKLGHMIFPIRGIDPNDVESLAVIMPTLGPKYFIFPFLAHAVGTLVGAGIAGVVALSHKMILSLAVGGIFLLGGIMVNYMIPGPTWFVIADIVIAYIPMAWIGGKFATNT